MARKEGDRITFTNTGTTTIKGGSLIHASGFYGVVYKNTKPNEEGVIEIEGVFEVPVNDPTVAINSGDKLSYINGKVQPVPATGGIVIGKAMETKPAGKATILIKLMPELY